MDFFHGQYEVYYRILQKWGKRQETHKPTSDIETLYCTTIGALKQIFRKNQLTITITYLAKRIIVFTSDPLREKTSNPLKIIKQAFFPQCEIAMTCNKPKKQERIPLLSMHSNNFSIRNIVKQMNLLLNRYPDIDRYKMFENR